MMLPVCGRLCVTCKALAVDRLRDTAWAASSAQVQRKRADLVEMRLASPEGRTYRTCSSAGTTGGGDMSGAMSESERERLMQQVRREERVAKTALKQRSAQLKAALEEQLAAVYRADDELWRDI